VISNLADGVLSFLSSWQDHTSLCMFGHIVDEKRNVGPYYNGIY